MFSKRLSQIEGVDKPATVVWQMLGWGYSQSALETEEVEASILVFESQGKYSGGI